MYITKIVVFVFEPVRGRSRATELPCFLCDSWLTLFFFRESWILLIIFVNFPIFFLKFICLDLYLFTVMIRNWLLMIDIGLLFSEMWRRSATISYQKLNYESWHTPSSDFKREYTRFCQHGASLWDHYDTPGAAISPEVTKISPIFFGTHYSRTYLGRRGVQGIRIPYFFGGDPPPPLFFFNRTPPPSSPRLYKNSPTHSVLVKVNCRRVITKICEISALSWWSKLIQNAPYITMHHL